MNSAASGAGGWPATCAQPCRRRTIINARPRTGQRAASSRALHCTALHCKTEDCAPAVQRRPQEAEQQQAVDLSLRGGIGKGADDGLATVT